MVATWQRQETFAPVTMANGAMRMTCEELMTGMTDQQLKDRVLQRLYDLRHEKHLVRLPDGLVMPDVTEKVLANILAQLRDERLVKWHRTSGGLCRGAAEITTLGVRSIEADNVVIPPEEIAMPTAHPTHTLIAWLTLVFGLALVITGIVLAWTRAEGQTEVTLFGSSFNSTSLGALVIFGGIVFTTLSIRRLLTSVERISQ